MTQNLCPHPICLLNAGIPGVHRHTQPLPLPSPDGDQIPELSYLLGKCYMPTKMLRTTEIQTKPFQRSVPNRSPFYGGDLLRVSAPQHILGISSINAISI